METIAPTPGLFELSIDTIGYSYLKDTARWAKFLAIVGFIFCAFFLLFAVLAGTLLSDMFIAMGSQAFSGAASIAIAIVYGGFAVINFFPCFYLFTFAVKMQKALHDNDQDQLNRSFKNMRSFYRFVGVLMIICLCVWALSLAIILVSSRIPHNTIQ